MRTTGEGGNERLEKAPKKGLLKAAELGRWMAAGAGATGSGGPSGTVKLLSRACSVGNQRCGRAVDVCRE
jgi:hypothetical protein